MAASWNGGLIRNLWDYHDLCAMIRAESHVAIDTETTGLRPYDGDVIRGISVAGRYWSAYVNLSHPGGEFTPPEKGLELFVALKYPGHVFHHAVFDWAFLHQVDPTWCRSLTIWDTQVGNWLIDENLKTGLKESADRILGHDSSAEKQALKKLTKETGRTWDTFTAEDIAAYAAMDARLTYDLREWQYKYADAHAPGLRDAMRRELEVQRRLYEMKRTGIAVDRFKLVENRDEKLARRIEIENNLPVNPSSPKQVAAWLFDECGYEPTVLTATGKPSTNKQVLADMVAYSPEAEILLEHRTLAKEVSAYYEPLIKFSGGEWDENADALGTIHPHFSSTRTVTGRLSCSEPNLMTIPREDVMGGVRECFVPRPGWELWEFDLNQAELRVIAGYAQEQAMIDAILDPERNLHKETAAAMFGENYTGLQYRFAKNLNYGFPYGIGPAKFATYIHPVPTEEHVRQASEVLAGYRRTYPNVVRLMAKMEAHAKKHKIVPLGWQGRYRHFSGPGYRVEPYTALNFIVQGGIGEFMKDVMIEVQDGREWRLCLQIHDALVFEVKPGWVGELHAALQGIADRVNPFQLPMLFERKEWK